MTKTPRLIDGERIRKAHSVKRVEPIQGRLATALGAIPELRYIKVFPERLAASNVLSAEGKNNPVVQVGADDLVGVELLIDSESLVVQFYALTSAFRGCGRKIVAAVVSATPEDWRLAVPLDRSGGFWQRMTEDYPRLSIF
jgi:hypothetical protein